MQHHTIVYVIDPDEGIGEALTTLLGTYGIHVRYFPDANNFLQAFPTGDIKHGCLLVEACLPGLSGLAMLRRLRAQGCELPVIVLNNSASDDISHQALRLGATDVLEKPLINAFLMERLAELLPNF